MSADRSLIGTLIALQFANDEQAQALIARLENPFTRRLVAREWRELRFKTVKEIR